MGGADYSVEWVTDLGRFQALAEPWEALVRGSPTPFGDHAWLRCWWEAFGAGRELRLATAWRDGALAGVLALCRNGTRLEALANDHTPLFVAPAREPGARAALIEAALAMEPRVLAVEAVPVLDPVREQLETASRRHGRIVLVEPGRISPIVETATRDLESYERSRGSRFREIRRRRRKLAREHAAEFVFDSDPDDLDTALDAGFAVEARGWKGRRGTAITSSAATESFYRAIAHAYLARGNLRLAWLLAHGHPAAFNLCLEHERRLFLLKTGFDEDFRALGPGLALTLDIVQRCFNSDVEAYELLGDDAPWKRMFATGERRHVRFRSYARGPIGLAHYAVRRRALPLLRAGSDRVRQRRKR